MIRLDPWRLRAGRQCVLSSREASGSVVGTVRGSCERNLPHEYADEQLLSRRGVDVHFRRIPLQEGDLLA